MNAEQERLKDNAWKNWGPYISDRQWGTVREDYSAGGDAWNYVTHDMARSKAYRWGEEGIAGICDSDQLLCFALAFWNKKDPIIKERYFGLTNREGNHGEDVKELYYYLDNTPTHAYQKMLYKYPQQQYPYQRLIDENQRRGYNDPEFELIDTGVFDKDDYFDIIIEYAKADQDDILIKITVNNRGPEDAALNVLPTIWFRNTWSWGYDDYQPKLAQDSPGVMDVYHKDLGQMYLKAEGNPQFLFTENNTNTGKLYNYNDGTQFHKDGINEHLLYGAETVNPQNLGTRACANYDVTVKAKSSVTLRLRLSADAAKAFDDFDTIFDQRQQEADDFYKVDCRA